MDRNHAVQIIVVIMYASLSARRAWIEMLSSRLAEMSDAVALRKESVDRNVKIMNVLSGLKPSLSARRAWIEISIDDLEPSITRSLSARRAWIEIPRPSITRYLFHASLSARRAWIEMDAPICCQPSGSRSLSARRAWIEIRYADRVAIYHKVALRKESVDRNGR